MNESTLIDPTSERVPAQRSRRAPPDDPAGCTVGLLDISKPRGSVYLDELERLLRDAGLKTRRYAKPTFTRPAPAELLGRIAAECELVVEALAD